MSNEKEKPEKRLDTEERRRQALQLHSRGWSYREIADHLSVSHQTIANDIKRVKEFKKNEVENFDREEYLVDTIVGYRDIIREAWVVYRDGNDETKIKSMNLIRQTQNDLRKALQDTGVVKREQQPIQANQFNFNFLSEINNKTVEEAIQTLVGLELTTELQDPEPPSEEDLQPQVIDVETRDSES